VTTVLRASPRNFVSTPSIERVATRALRYLQSGFSVHLRGPAGTGKTTLALHLADLLTRPIMLLFGDDEFKTSDLIGNQSGYTRKKVVDNFIHSVVKVEDELRQNWVDSRLTLACREGFTLVYDEFNRSRPEVNNVLLSALEEKLLVLPPSNNRTEYIRVNPHFRAIFTSNPEEYCGVHDTQDALMDRLVTINIPEPDELTQQEIVVQKTGIDREGSLTIVRLVKTFRTRTGAEKSSGLRSCLMLAKVCNEHGILAMPENPEFRDICQDVLLSRASLPLADATQLLWQLFNELICDSNTSSAIAVMPNLDAMAPVAQPLTELVKMKPTVAPPLAAVQTPEVNVADTHLPNASAPEAQLSGISPESPAMVPDAGGVTAIAESTLAPATVSEPQPEPAFQDSVPYEQEVYNYLQTSQDARPSEIEAALTIGRYETVNALRALTAKGLLTNQSSDGKAVAYRVRTAGGDQV
jgi:gas vesicle protein GvpN